MGRFAGCYSGIDVVLKIMFLTVTLSACTKLIFTFIGQVRVFQILSTSVLFIILFKFWQHMFIKIAQLPKLLSFCWNLSLCITQKGICVTCSGCNTCSSFNRNLVQSYFLERKWIEHWFILDSNLFSKLLKKLKNWGKTINALVHLFYTPE